MNSLDLGLVERALLFTRGALLSSRFFERVLAFFRAGGTGDGARAGLMGAGVDGAGGRGVGSSASTAGGVREPEHFQAQRNVIPKSPFFHTIGNSDSPNQGPVYDLRWGQIAPETPSDSGSSGLDDTLGDQGPVYDLGWGPTAPEIHLDSASSGPEDDDLVYDLGWGQTAPEIQSDGTSSGPEDDEPLYDLGWGGFSSDEQPMDEDSAESDDEDSLAYNLSWGVGATGTNQDVIDLTDDNGLTCQGNNVIDLTQSSPGPMDLDRDESPGGTTEHDSASSAGHFMFHYNRPTMPVANDPSSPAKCTVFRANRQMKAIGHDMLDQHVHAIVENVVHGLNLDQVPAQILMVNRRVLDTFADA
ncbi:hypothetical protein F4604DRAFT_1678549 [Suillus subluteus]|nr:hypothetical protein F4604DRAFT_1678549 [Suillus subluteus]